MFYGAISTDIKKSSANWNLDSDWMRRAVRYTNTISEMVFEKSLDTKINQLQLPNSPEGDAYTFYFWTSEQEEYLKSHLQKVASLIQYNLKRARESIPFGDEEGVFLCGYSTEKMKEKLKKMILDKTNSDKQKMSSLMDMYEHCSTGCYDYIGNIYLRIGIATSPNKAIKYYFNNKESYRGGVIRMSEKAEEKAPYKSGYGEYIDSSNVVPHKNEEISTIVLSKGDILSKDSDYTYNGKSGFIIFVHYKMVLTEELLRKHTHIYENVRDEFRTLHDITVMSLQNIGATLVKIKRDSSSMYFIHKMSRFKKQRIDIWDECSKLLAILPDKCSIGIAYGESTNLTEVTKKGLNKDYFGPTVNIAARMVSLDWDYPTSVGDTIPSSHMNRIAYADMNRQNIVEILEPPKGNQRTLKTNTAAFIPYPYTVDQIPIVRINVGYSGYVYVLSKHLHGKSEFRIGSRVKWMSGNEYRHGVIVEISLNEVLVEWNSDKKWIPLSLLEMDIDEGSIDKRVKTLFEYKFKF